jgi:cytidylate kinase
MRIAHEARAFRQWESQWADDDWLEAEEDRIMSDARQLGEACFEADPKLTIEACVAIEAQRRLKEMKENAE